jgi:anti-sigma regulatory factor (Ser/Thr protein kinase)
MKPREFALPVPASPPAVTDARHRAVKAIGHWGGELDAEVLQTAELVLSELLTNAVQHAGTGRISLMLRRLPDAVRIEVDDANSVLPKLDPSDAYNEHGRGMLLVSVLADRYGTERTCEGKRCWAEINLPTPLNRQLSLVPRTVPALADHSPNGSADARWPACTTAPPRTTRLRPLPAARQLPLPRRTSSRATTDADDDGAVGLLVRMLDRGPDEAGSDGPGGIVRRLLGGSGGPLGRGGAPHDLTGSGRGRLRPGLGVAA